MAASFATEPASKQQILIMLAVSGAMVLAAVVMSYYADVTLVAISAFPSSCSALR